MPNARLRSWSPTSCRFEDFDGPLKLAVLRLSSQFSRAIGGHPVADPGVNLCLGNRPAQRLRRDTEARGDRSHAGRAGVVFLGMIGDQPNRPGLEIIVVLLRHDANYLPSKDGVHKTRGGSGTKETAACMAGGSVSWNAASVRWWPTWRSPASWLADAGRWRSWRTDRHLICFLPESGGGSAWIDPRHTYVQPFVATSDARQADAIQPNPSCGSHFAYISLTARRQLHAHHTGSPGSNEAPSA